MGKMIGYMVTWTTYGSWLEGDERGYVKKGEIQKLNRTLKVIGHALQKSDSVKLNKKQREIISDAIESAAKRLNEVIFAISVCSDHVHIVGKMLERPIEDLVKTYKNAGYFAVYKEGFRGKLWTAGYDKRYCFDEESLDARIKYVNRHK